MNLCHCPASRTFSTDLLLNHITSLRSGLFPSTQVICRSGGAEWLLAPPSLRTLPRGPWSAASHFFQATPLLRKDRLFPFFLLVEDGLSENDAGTSLLTPIFLEIYLAHVGLFAQGVGDYFTNYPKQPLHPVPPPQFPLHHLSTWLLTRNIKNFIWFPFYVESGRLKSS